LRRKAHVEHSISLIDDKSLNWSRIKRVLPDQIQQATRRTDQKIDASSKHRNLWLNWSRANCNACPQHCAAGELLGDGPCLIGEFPGWTHNKPAKPTARWNATALCWPVFEYSLKHWRKKRDRLSTASLGQ
jgi:hypothetical protein